MDTKKKSLFAILAFILVFTIIACSCRSLSPSLGGVAPTTIVVPPSSNSTQEPGVPATPGGASSASGTRVSAGPATIEQVSGQVNLQAGETGSGVATCPEGSLMLGGGFAAGKGILITKSRPDASGWLVGGMNGTSEALVLSVYAVCLKNASGSTHIVSEDVPVSGAPFARCQKGELVTGGGFADASGSLEVYISTPIGDSVDPNNAWSVMARSSQNADQPITVYAVCLAGSDLRSTLARDEKVDYGPGGDSLDFNITCPSGFRMVSGGYEGSFLYTNRLSPTDAGVWEIQVAGKDYFDGSLDHAVCLALP